MPPLLFASLSSGYPSISFRSISPNIVETQKATLKTILKLNTQQVRSPEFLIITICPQSFLDLSPKQQDVGEAIFPSMLLLSLATLFRGFKEFALVVPEEVVFQIWDAPKYERYVFLGAHKQEGYFIQLTYPRGYTTYVEASEGMLGPELRI